MSEKTVSNTSDSRKVIVDKRKNYQTNVPRRKIFDCVFSPGDLLQAHSRLSHINLEGFDEYVTKTITTVFDDNSMVTKSNKTIPRKKRCPKISFWKNPCENFHLKISNKEYLSGAN